MSKRFAAAFVCVVILTQCGASAQELIDLSTKKEAEHAIEFGLKWLEQNQMPNGSWSNYPALTGLGVTAFLKSPHGYNEKNSYAVSRAMEFILKCQQKDGGIYVDDLACYNTAICLMAMVAAKNPAYDDAIRRARDFLLSQQFDESTGVEKSDVSYGGVGYKEKERPDLSNLQWTLEALKASEDQKKVIEATGKEQESSGKHESPQIAASKNLFWERAITFVQRCQNLKATNDQSWSGNDGGFIYNPSESKAGEHTSYGSMTYAGMKSFIYAGVDRNDKRVQAAYNWIRNHFTVDLNPELGTQGLFYYYQTMAKALNAYGQDMVTDSAGMKHNWRKELVAKLISIQDGEGFWVNKNNRWWENKKDLVTSFTVLAMEQTLQ